MKREHSTFNVQLRTPKCGANGRPLANGCWAFNVQCWAFLFLICLCSRVLGATIDATNTPVAVSRPPLLETARGFYNAGTDKLRAGKLGEAESLLGASLARQDEAIQPMALFNLGHVRFAQGIEELKKSQDAGAVNRRSHAAEAAGSVAIDNATAALASNDVQQMVQAYMAGRGVRKELRSATQAVNRAMEAYGKTLLKWRRSLNDFKSAAELNPADTNAVRNAEIAEQAIAKLVDSLRDMQQSAAKLGGKKEKLDGLLKQLRGQIPAPNMPPGAPGEEEEDDEGENGEKPKPEALSGKEESNKGGGGKEMGLNISPEDAGQLLNGLLPDGKQLPMGQGETGQPKKTGGRIW